MEPISSRPDSHGTVEVMRNNATMTDDGPFVSCPLTTQAVVDCAFSSWYSRFKGHTLRGVALTLPSDFLAWLSADGLVLPEGSDGVSDEPPHSPDGSNVLQRFAFPELDIEMRRAIENYGGSVFPKFNWTSPQDAAFMNATQTLQCHSPADVYLLLKSSDLINHDLEHAFDGCVDIECSQKPPLQLILKKWFDMPRSNEFRCFVKAKRLVAISARDDVFYPFLQPAALQASLVERLQTFFDDVVSPRFPGMHYVFDAYLTRSFDRVFLVDFNVFAPRTDSLLFSWPEIMAMSPDSPVLRVVQLERDTSQIRPRYAHNRVPADVTFLSHDFAATAWQQALAEATRSADAD